jgi:hypothetical protein
VVPDRRKKQCGIAGGFLTMAVDDESALSGAGNPMADAESTTEIDQDVSKVVCSNVIRFDDH